MGNTDWQPIETAPKYEIVIVYAGDVGVGMKVSGKDEDWWTYDPHEIDPSPCEIINPSHWMPLPSPPESKPNYYVSDGHESENEIASTPGGIR